MFFILFYLFFASGPWHQEVLVCSSDSRPGDCIYDRLRFVDASSGDIEQHTPKFPILSSQSWADSRHSAANMTSRGGQLVWNQIISRSVWPTLITQKSWVPFILDCLSLLSCAKVSFVVRLISRLPTSDINQAGSKACSPSSSGSRCTWFCEP